MWNCLQLVSILPSDLISFQTNPGIWFASEGIWLPPLHTWEQEHKPTSFNNSDTYSTYLTHNNNTFLFIFPIYQFPKKSIQNFPVFSRNWMFDGTKQSSHKQEWWWNTSTRNCIDSTARSEQQKSSQLPRHAWKASKDVICQGMVFRWREYSTFLSSSCTWFHILLKFEINFFGLLHSRY